MAISVQSLAYCVFLVFCFQFHISINLDNHFLVNTSNKNPSIKHKIESSKNCIEYVL